MFPTAPDPVPEFNKGICLEKIANVDGNRVVTGFDRRGFTLDPTTAGVADDFLSQNFPSYEYGLLVDPDSGDDCDFFVFNINGQGERSGRYLTLQKYYGDSPLGEWECVISSNTFRGPMVGVRATAENTACPR